MQFNAENLNKVFHGFGQAKFAHGGSILSSSQFTLLSQLPLNTMFSLKVVKIDSKISFVNLNLQHTLYVKSFFKKIKKKSKEPHKNESESDIDFLSTRGVEANIFSLQKSCPGVNFISILRTVFTRTNPKSVNIQSGCQYLFVLWNLGT